MTDRQDTNIASSSKPKIGEPAPSTDREYYTGSLQNLFLPSLEPQHKQFVTQWDHLLPAKIWGEWEVSWLRALAAYGTPISFLDGLQMKVQEFEALGMTWPCFSWEGGDYDSRRALTAAQERYAEKIPIELRAPLRITRECVLCENVLQALDNFSLPEIISQNAMIDLGDYLIVPNRYPGAPLHMLWLPKNHGEMRARVTAQPSTDDDGKPAIMLPAQENKTRGNLVTSSELEALFSFCNATGLVAVRNHPLSGMSIREHDHWHLLPLECYPKKWFEDIVGALQAGTGMQTQTSRAQGTPFDVLVLQNLTSQTLANDTAHLLNALELDDQIFSPTYVPTGTGMVLVAPLRKAVVGSRFVQIGGSVQSLQFSPDDETMRKRLEQYVPKRQEFDWTNFGVPAPLT